MDPQEEASSVVGILGLGLLGLSFYVVVCGKLSVMDGKGSG